MPADGPIFPDRFSAHTRCLAWDRGAGNGQSQSRLGNLPLILFLTPRTIPSACAPVHPRMPL
jgi:hypothetical protein